MLLIDFDSKHMQCSIAIHHSNNSVVGDEQQIEAHNAISSYYGLSIGKRQKSCLELRIGLRPRQPIGTYLVAMVIMVQNYDYD